jgi:hypothetical protein
MWELSRGTGMLAGMEIYGSTLPIHLSCNNSLPYPPLGPYGRNIPLGRASCPKGLPFFVFL